MSDQLAGDYTVLVTDDNGCQSSHTSTIPLDSTFQVTDIFSEPTTCYNESTGEACVSVDGGFAPYTYDWTWYSNTESSQQIHDVASSLQPNLPFGMASVTITDGTGCVMNDQVFVHEPSELTYKLEKLQDQTCHGSVVSCDGSIIIDPDGGTGVYEYVYSDIFNNPIASVTTTGMDTITALCEGYYYFTITDASGCMGHLVDSDESNPVQIIEGQEVIVSIDDDNIENNTICFGDEATYECIKPNFF